MNEENPRQNQVHPSDKASGSGWEFFIAKEEENNKLNQKESAAYSGIVADRKERAKITDWIVAFFTIVIALVDISSGTRLIEVRPIQP